MRTSKLTRSLNKTIRLLEEDIDFLRSSLWELTGGKHDYFQLEEPRRREEPVEPSVIDPIVKDILTS